MQFVINKDTDKDALAVEIATRVLKAVENGIDKIAGNDAEVPTMYTLDIFVNIRSAPLDGN